VKIRIGFGLGIAWAGAERFGDLVDGLEDLGFDSLWLSERAAGPAPDPLVGLAVAAGRTRRLKLGTSVQVLPGRNPALLAKSWASLDVLSGGRTLPAFGLGVADATEQHAFGVDRAERAAWFEEALPLVRRFWTEDGVVHHGPRFRYDGLTVLPKPVQQPPDVWLGGRAPSELRRAGRLGDGWLASFTAPSQCEAGRAMIEEAAAGAGRAIDPEHFGAMILCAAGGIPDALVDVIRARNPGTDPAEYLAGDPATLRTLCERFVAAGFSKLVVVPIGDTDDQTLTALADSVLGLQT
jgi:probable F420-dependent oxidoreductase